MHGVLRPPGVIAAATMCSPVPFRHHHVDDSRQVLLPKFNSTLQIAFARRCTRVLSIFQDSDNPTSLFEIAFRPCKLHSLGQTADAFDADEPAEALPSLAQR